MLEEEHALILEGQVTLLLGDERHEMKAGDYVCFPAGRKVGHSFLNSGPGPCSYLMIGEHNPNEVCVYPGLEQDGGRARCARRTTSSTWRRRGNTGTARRRISGVRTHALPVKFAIPIAGAWHLIHHCRSEQVGGAIDCIQRRAFPGEVRPRPGIPRRPQAHP